MAWDQDPLGYYRILGVDQSATVDSLKKAFRAKAQALHPDKNRSEQATRQFQLLNKAYQVLSNPKTRAEYDAESYAADCHTSDRPSNNRSFKPVKPFSCSVCGRISAQPRYAIYRRVVSVLIITHRSGRQGIFCSDCGAKRAYRESLITWIFGWWGFPWGPIHSIRAILTNMLGGEQPALNNFRVVSMQAAYFASTNKLELPNRPQR